MYFKNTKHFYLMISLLFFSCGQDFSKEDKENTLFIEVPVSINLLTEKKTFKLFNPTDYRIDIEGCSSSYSQRGINTQNDSINLRQGDQGCVAILSSFVMDGVSYNAPTSALGANAVENNIWAQGEGIILQGEDSSSEAFVTVQTQLETINESSSISFSIRSLKKGNKSIYDKVCFADHETKLNNCITNSVDGSVIIIDGTILLSSTLVIDKDISLMGWDSTTSIIDGNSSYRILTISQDTSVNITDIKFQNGVDPTDGLKDAGAIFFSSGSSGSVKNCDFSTGNENPSIYFDASSQDNISSFCGNYFTDALIECESGTCITNEANCPP